VLRQARLRHGRALRSRACLRLRRAGRVSRPARASRGGAAAPAARRRRRLQARGRGPRRALRETRVTPSREKPALAYVAHSLNPGGTERLVADMALAFAADHRVEVFCLDEPGTWARDVRRQGVPVHGLWRVPGFDAALPWRLARGLRAM